MVGVWLRMKRRRDAVTCQKTSLFTACIKKLSQRYSARNAVVYSCKSLRGAGVFDRDFVQCREELLGRNGFWRSGSPSSHVSLILVLSLLPFSNRRVA